MEYISALVNRNTPKIADKFKFEKIEKENGHDVCEFYSENGKIVICGNSVTSLSERVRPGKSRRGLWGDAFF